MEKLNILLLGGTGAIGAHLANILAEQGHNVDVTTRSKRESKGGVNYIQGNGYDESLVNDLLSKKHYDALVDFLVYKTEHFGNVICKRCAKVGQHVFISSSRVYADCKGLITEDSPRLLDVSNDEEYLKTEEYALEKAREENALRNCGYTNWTIIRPYITYSETRLQLGVMEKEDWLYRHLHGHTIVFSKDIANSYTTLTYGKDVSRGIAAIIGQEKAYGEAFHITHPQAVTWQELFNIYLEVLEERGGCPAKVLMTEESVNLRYSGMKWQVLNDRQLNRRFDNSKIGQFIDVNTFVNPIEGLKMCLNTFLDSPKFNKTSWFYDVYKDRICGDRASLSEFPSKKDYLKYMLCRYLLPTSRL